MRGRATCCGAPCAPSVRTSSSRARVACWRRPKSRWPCATSAGSPRALAAATATLEKHGDRANALHARLLAARRSLLLGRLAERQRCWRSVDLAACRRRWPQSPNSRAPNSRCARCGPRRARAALARAHQAAYRARHPFAIAEVAQARTALERPAARRWRAARCSPCCCDEVEALLASDALVRGCLPARARAARRLAAAGTPARAVRAGARARASLAAGRASAMH